MIRFTDAAVLAVTKLRTHRVRTGLTVGLAGILFGLILAVIFLVQGMFDSIERFSGEGLNNRVIMNIAEYQSSGTFGVYEHATDKKFIHNVEAKHKADVDKKTAAAKKYGVEYDPKIEDPSPIQVDPKTKERSVSEAGLLSSYAQDAAEDYQKANAKPFDIKSYLQPYPSARILNDNMMIAPTDGVFTIMKNSTEERFAASTSATDGNDQQAFLMTLNGSLTKPFISNKTFDPSKGEIPLILPYSEAEKQLGLKPLARTADNQAKLDRIQEVRDRIGEVSISYCYRNAASEQLLGEAIAQADELKRMKDQPGYMAPSLEYKVPAATSCGAVTVVKDTRTAEEKQQAVNRIAYEKEIGAYLGKPAQQKVQLRGVGISSDLDYSSSLSSVAEMVRSLLASNLGSGWVVPAGLLRQVPEEYRPSGVFHLDDPTTAIGGQYGADEYLVEFGDKAEARQLIDKTGGIVGQDGGVFVYPFGSSILIVDEAKTWFAKFMLWAFILVGGVAAIILSGLIGRTVSEGRRESAVFRAIGAKRTDVASIYGAYTLLLSLRVVLFAAILGGLLALVVELLYWRDATLAARLAYAASDTKLEFHLFGAASWYVLIVIGVIMAAGVLGAVIPIARNARRNPINDMRDE